MSVNFVQPLYLLLIPVAIAFVIFVKTKSGRAYSNHAVYKTVRSLVFTVLILALAGPTVRGFTDKITTVLAVDLSHSISSEKERILSIIKSAYTENIRDSVGIVCFGADAKVETMPTEDFSPSLNTSVSPNYSNIDSGLKMSGTVLPEDSKKRIVLFTDGLENMGDALTQAKVLRDRGTELNIYPISGGLAEEVQLVSVNIPKYLKKSTQYPIEISAFSLTQTNAQIFVYRDNQLIAQDEVVIRQGENKYIFKDISHKSGGTVYRAEIVAEKDTFQQNNRLYAYSYIEGEPNILLIGSTEDTDELKKILDAAGANLNRVQPSQVTEDLQVLNTYDEIILANTPVSSLSEDFLKSLESYVKDNSGGLLVTGGENAYALGDYYDTPLETVLPVEMQLKDKDDKANLGLITVIDRSGSMGMGEYGVSKLEMAKEALIRSADNLKKDDFLGVISFDTEFDWSLEFMQVGENTGYIKEKIAKINMGGGTSILPALTEAYNKLATADTKLKHIVLLTDGQAEQTGYDSLITMMREAGITLSTVAVGTDSDTVLLNKLALTGGGRYYFTNEFTDLPKIFVKETKLAGRDYLVNEDFYPVADYDHPILKGVESLPKLSGYVATTPKSTAEVVLRHVNQKGIPEPILACWQYGLGKTAAWTTDLKGNRTAEWLSSDEGIKTVLNMVSWTMRKQDASQLNISTKANGTGTDILIDFPYYSDILSVRATLVSSEGVTHDVTFDTVAPGKYSGFLPENTGDVYTVNMEISRYGSTQRFVTGLSIGYPPEYDIRNKERGLQLLKNMAQISGGMIIDRPEQVFQPLKLKDNGYTDTDLSDIFLTLGIILFLADIAIRRFPGIIRLLSFKPKLKKPAVPAPVVTKTVMKNKETKPETQNNAPTPKEQKQENLSSVLLVSKKKRTGK